MSLYHETAAIVTAPSTHGGSLKSRIFNNKSLKSPPAQVYALAFESSKWSAVLKEVIENSQLLQHERKLTPALAVLLVHDFLLAKNGIALPPSHGLRAAVERHKMRLQSEFTRARIRRKCPTLEALKAAVEAQVAPVHPRWIRVNAIKSTVDEQLDTTFQGFEVVPTVEEVVAAASTGRKVISLDGHVPNLIAAPPGIDFTKTEAYRAGKIILQDKASCFPAYLLDPRPEDGDIIDACSAPGNKTTHLTAILHERGGLAPGRQRIFAFEKDEQRARTLEKMVRAAGAADVTVVRAGHDFLKTDPNADEFRNVGALLLDPSCSGSGIQATQTTLDGTSSSSSSSSSSSLQSRLAALASFQLALLQHAFAFPAATKITYSTCSEHAAENEAVVRAALRSAVARRRGWRVLPRRQQVRGLREWPVRGDPAGFAQAAARGEEAEKEEEEEGGMDVGEVVEGCVRARKGDGKGVMGFFVVCFVRDPEVKRRGEGGEEEEDDDDDGPFVRDAQGRIVRDENGIPTLKRTGKKAIELDEEAGDGAIEIRFGGGEDEDGDGPFVRDHDGRIVRDADGMPRLKRGGGEVEEGGDEDDEDEDGEDEEEEGEEEEGEEEEWGGFDD